jgi:hypothetical protein
MKPGCKRPAERVRAPDNRASGGFVALICGWAWFTRTLSRMAQFLSLYPKMFANATPAVTATYPIGAHN